MTRFTPAAIITSSAALSNLLSGPTGRGGVSPQTAASATVAGTLSPSSAAANNNGINTTQDVAPSPKRRYSDAVSEVSDPYYISDSRPRKSPRPDAHYATPARQPSGIPAQSSPAVPQGSAVHQTPQQPSGQPSQRHAQARMRSSIACVRCRRSKVKCVNSGVGTPCRSCEAGGRECTYPVPVSSGRRRESVVGQPGKSDGPVEDQVGWDIVSWNCVYN